MSDFFRGKEQSIKLLLLLPQSVALFSLEQHYLLNLLCSWKAVDYGVMHVPRKMTENHKHSSKASGKYIFVLRLVFKKKNNQRHSGTISPGTGPVPWFQTRNYPWNCLVGKSMLKLVQYPTWNQLRNYLFHCKAYLDFFAISDSCSPQVFLPLLSRPLHCWPKLKILHDP